LTNLRYLIPRATGTVCFIGSFATLLLGRIEALVPVLFIGIALVTFSETRKRLRVEFNPIAVKAEAGLSTSFKILGASVIVNFLTASLGLAYETGFSSVYASSLLAGMTLTLLGIFWGAGSMFSAKKKTMKTGSDTQTDDRSVAASLLFALFEVVRKDAIPNPH